MTAATAESATAAATATTTKPIYFQGNHNGSLIVMICGVLSWYNLIKGTSLAASTPLTTATTTTTSTKPISFQGN